MKKFMMSAVALSLLGIAGTGAANAAAIETETVTVTGNRIVKVSEEPTAPRSYQQLQRERLSYFRQHGTPREGTYAAAVMKGCYWDNQGMVCARF